MSRIASTAKGGFYPLDPKMAKIIASLFTNTTNSRIADFCAGQGEAIEIIAKQFKTENVYTNELQQSLWEELKIRFATAHNEDFLTSIRISPQSLNFMLLNPPYDTTSKEVDDEGNKIKNSNRMEYLFLKHVHDKNWLQSNGYLVYVVYKQHISSDVIRHFKRNYKNIHILFLPGKHLDSYDQLIVIAQVGRGIDTEESIQEQLDNPMYITDFQGTFELPTPKPMHNFLFSSSNITIERAIEIIESDGTSVFTNSPLLKTSLSTTQDKFIRLPNDGQLAALLSAGLFDGLVFYDKYTGLPFAVRSFINREPVLADSDTITTKKGHVKVVETFESRPIPRIIRLDDSGDIVDISSDESLIEFITLYSDDLYNHIRQSITPTYEEDFAGIGDYLNELRKDGKYSLYDAQKHIVAAAVQTLLNRKGMYIVGEQGVGKSLMSVVILRLLWENKFRGTGDVILIECPGTLLKKWKREIHAVYGDVQVFIVKTEENDKKTGNTAISQMANVFKYADRHRDVPVVAIFSYNTAKDHAKWKSSIRSQAKILEDQKKEPVVINGMFPNLKEVSHFKKRPVMGSDGNYLKQYGKFISEVNPYCSATGEIIRVPRGDEQFVPQIDDYFVDQRRSRQFEVTKPGKDHYLSKVRKTHDPYWSEYRGFKGDSINPRYALGEFIKKRYPNKVGLFIIDEVHSIANEHSDISLFAMKIASKAKNVIGLTGTLYGGKASSVFNLEHLVNPDMRKLYPFSDEGKTKWINDMGVLQETRELDLSDKQVGVYSGRIRFGSQGVVELPGCSPELIRKLADHVLYMSINDISDTMPDYTETTIGLDMLPEQQNQYKKAYETCNAYLKACRMNGDNSFTGRYIQTLLRMSTACFRGEEVIHLQKPKRNGNRYFSSLQQKNEVKSITVHKIEGLSPDVIYPKEQWLIDYINEKLNIGSGVTVYISQTDTKDIRGRIFQLIEENCPLAKPFILNAASPESKKREEHILKLFDEGYNVMVTNPKLVQVGLDLLATPNLVFFETDYSLYVVAQAARRAYRANQDKDCETIYLYYKTWNETIPVYEQSAVEIISHKDRSANVLYGRSGFEGLSALTTSPETNLIKLIAQKIEKAS